MQPVVSHSARRRSDSCFRAEALPASAHRLGICRQRSGGLSKNAGSHRQTDFSH